MMIESKFNKLAEVKIAPDRYVVVSERNGKISVAQCQEVTDQYGKAMRFYWKNAILCTASQAKELSQALNTASREVRDMFLADDNFDDDSNEDDTL